MISREQVLPLQILLVVYETDKRESNGLGSSLLDIVRATLVESQTVLFRLVRD